MPFDGSTSTGFWGTVRMMTGVTRRSSWSCGRDGEPAHPALEQGVDDHDVRLELLDLALDLGAVGHDVEQLDLWPAN